ncbi:MAG: signal peptidase II [Verrucomicrobiota bacterium]
MTLTPNRRMALIASLVFLADQMSKMVVLKFLHSTQERIIVPGFFKFVHWVNTGAAWSLFHDQNTILAIVSFLAFIGLFALRNRFDTKTIMGQVSLGLIFGGILGNLLDRVHPARHHVIDFLRFYIDRRNGEEIGFPAFNIADSAICVGVGLLFIMSWRSESASEPTAA